MDDNQFCKLPTMRTITFLPGFVIPMDRKQHMAELPERVDTAEVKTLSQDPRGAFYRLVPACIFLPIRQRAALVHWKGRGSLEGHCRAENPCMVQLGNPLAAT